MQRRVRRSLLSAWDVVTIGEMVIRIDEDDEAKARYTCRHLNRSKGECTIYTRRPQMCSDFPGYSWDGACHLCGWQKPKEPHVEPKPSDAGPGGGWRAAVGWMRDRNRNKP